MIPKHLKAVFYQHTHHLQDFRVGDVYWEGIDSGKMPSREGIYQLPPATLMVLGTRVVSSCQRG